MTCTKCNNAEAQRFGRYGKRKVQRYRCKACGATFSAPQKDFGKHTIDTDRVLQVVGLLMEGMSIRSVARVTGVHKNTIMALVVTVGRKCQEVLDRYVGNLKPKYVQADELWTFVHTKEKHLRHDDPADWGDAYIWLAIDSESKLLISYLVGKRDAHSAMTFVRDFGQRLNPLWRCQFTSDGFRAYIPAVEETFGADIDFAQLIKIYGKPDIAGPDWYGPPKVIETVPTPISGDPKMERISTSHIERANLSVRTHLRRFTRLSLGFSKKLENLKATVALFAAYYNLCRVHMTLRVTPAMEAGLTDHVWTLYELLTAEGQRKVA